MQVVCADRAISGRCYVILCLTLWTSGMRANDCIACNLPNYPANTVLQSKKLEVTHYFATTKKSFMMFCQWRNKLLKTDTDLVFNGRVTTESNGLSCCTEQTDDSQVWLCGGHMMVSINSSSGSVAINIALIYWARGARCTLLSNAQQWFLYMFLPLVFSWNHRKYRLCSNHSDFGCQSRENTVRFMWLLRITDEDRCCLLPSPLAAQRISPPCGSMMRFAVDPLGKKCCIASRSPVYKALWMTTSWQTAGGRDFSSALLLASFFSI